MSIAIDRQNMKSFGSECLTTLHKGFKHFADFTVALFADPEGLAYVTDLFISVVDAAEKLKIFKAGENLSKFVKTITPLSTFLGCTILIFDIEDWVKKDDKDGKYLHQKSWQKVAEKVVWTISHVFDLLSWIADFRPGLLAPVATPLAIVDTAIKTLGCVFGIWSNLRTIHQTYKKPCYKNLGRRISKWEQREKAWAQINRKSITETKLTKWTKSYDKLKASEKLKGKLTDKENHRKKKAKLKMKQWTMLQSCSKADLIRFCQSKTNRLKDQKYNRELKLNRSVANIALYVATIALLVLTVAATIAGVGGPFLPFLLIGLPIVINIFDLGHFLIATFMKKRKLTELEII